MSQSVELTAAERLRFAALADAILPATADMPAPSSVGVSGALFDRALAALPPVTGVLREILSRPAEDTRGFLEELKATQPEHFATLVLVVAATYYLAESVRERLGYHGQEALRIDVSELPGYLEDGTLDRVTARGPIYKDVDPD